MEPKTTGKRIVSKGRYVQVVGIKSVLWLVRLCLLALLMLCVPLTGWAAFGTTSYGLGCLLPRAFSSAEPIDVLRWGLGTVLSAALTFTLYKMSEVVFYRSVKLDDSIPLTRANAAYLPVPDTLVRPCEEPKQAQEAVLLRAATERVDTPPEQLVRAVGSREQA